MAGSAGIAQMRPVKPSRHARRASRGPREMAETPSQTPAGTPQNGNGAQPTLNILAQYLKDLSFESPGAPISLRGRPDNKAPAININVNVNANSIADKQYDV